jgi:hypothetical protein
MKMQSAKIICEEKNYWSFSSTIVFEYAFVYHYRMKCEVLNRKHINSIIITVYIFISFSSYPVFLAIISGKYGADSNRRR